MIPLIEILNKLRTDKKITKARIAKSIGISSVAYDKLVASASIPNEHIEAVCKGLKLDIPNIQALHQYNERESVYRSLPEVVAGRLVPHGMKYKLATILYFNIPFDLPQNTYMKELYPNPPIIDETIRAINDSESRQRDRDT